MIMKKNMSGVQYERLKKKEDQKLLSNSYSSKEREENEVMKKGTNQKKAEEFKLRNLYKEEQQRRLEFNKKLVVKRLNENVCLFKGVVVACLRNTRFLVKPIANVSNFQKFTSIAEDEIYHTYVKEEQKNLPESIRQPDEIHCYIDGKIRENNIAIFVTNIVEFVCDRKTKNIGRISYRYEYIYADLTDNLIARDSEPTELFLGKVRKRGLGKGKGK
uniref:Uncharacterized protein n=1 Tax=Prototheca stagnorum TaxID=215448 RepID=A0A2Z6BEM2_9CHLO|nr:hypothetical protein [Prototheca stagnorum]BBD20174.1 hypothetical protein [Prototheca stagnorum]